MERSQRNFVPPHRPLAFNYRQDWQRRQAEQARLRLEKERRQPAQQHHNLKLKKIVEWLRDVRFRRGRPPRLACRALIARCTGADPCFLRRKG